MLGETPGLGEADRLSGDSLGDFFPRGETSLGGLAGGTVAGGAS